MATLYKFFLYLSAPTNVKFEIGGGDKDGKPPEEEDPVITFTFFVLHL